MNSSINQFRRYAYVMAIVLALLFAAASMGCACQATWYSYTGITGGSITAPANGSYCGPNSHVNCTITNATDQDARVCLWENPQITYPYDTFNNSGAYSWSATGGSWLNGNTGQNVTWVAPATAGSYTITCTISDDAVQPSGDQGNHNDTNVQRQVTVNVDASAPTGSVTVNSGAAYTNSTTVTLTLSASDTGGSGLAGMRFSNDGASWSSWENYGTSKSWDLSSGEGAKTVYAQYRDGALNVSSSYSDAITVDLSDPTVSITTPSGSQLHLASGQTTVQLAGIAADTGSGIDHVQVGFTTTGSGTPPTTWNTTSYNSTTHIWTYNWSSPTTQKVWVKATDLASRTTTTSLDVTVSTSTVKYVSPNGDDSTGASWTTAKHTIQGGIDAAASGNEVWVAEGTYTECVNHKSGVGLYGGFVGYVDAQHTGETAREQRNWAANATIIDGNQLGSVVTIPSGASSSTIIDGFTIQNGVNDGGGGIYCSSASATIANNIIRDNFSCCGGGLYAADSSLTVAGNVFVLNSAAFSYGGGIYYSNTGGQIANNTIIRNEASWGDGDGGGIYLNSSSPTLSNNIIAYNTQGGISDGYGTPPTCQNNDVFGNGSYEYSWTTRYPVGTDLEPVDPVIPNIDSADWHIHQDSPCVGAGTNSIISAEWKDIDGEPRIQPTNGVVDIGADESDGCWWYTATMSNNPCYETPGESVDVTVHLADWYGNPPDHSVPVAITTTGGTITQPVTGTEYHAFTDVSGNVVVTVTRSTVGCVIVTAEFPRSSGTESSSKSHSVWFYDSNSPLVDIFFCLDSTGSMRSGGDYGAIPSVETFLSEMSNTYGIMFRVGGLRFNEGSPDSILSSQKKSLDVSTTVSAFTGWLDTSYHPGGGDAAELQLDALHYAAQDMNAYAISSHKYIVLITDCFYHYNGDGDTNPLCTSLTKAGMISELTATGCTVYISLWDTSPNHNFYQSYYSGLTVNSGEFDPSKDDEYYPTEPLYPLANLRARILADLGN